MRGMFRRKLKDFAEEQRDNCERIPLIDRLIAIDPLNHQDDFSDIGKDFTEFNPSIIERIPPQKPLYIP